MNDLVAGCALGGWCAPPVVLLIHEYFKFIER